MCAVGCVVWDLWYTCVEWLWDIECVVCAVGCVVWDLLYTCVVMGYRMCGCVLWGVLWSVQWYVVWVWCVV